MKKFVSLEIFILQGPHKLLVFAHRPEAQAFLKEYHLDAISGMTPQLYRGKEFYLLITGEGIISATQMTALALAQLQHISEIWNLGIAGSLDNSLLLNEIYPIRTCYGELGDQIQFKTFNSNFNKVTIDCLSSDQRVLTEEKGKTLSNFAQVVDRECWGIGSICQQLKIDFYPVKLISDFPLNNNTEICAIIKEQAEVFSDLLCRWWSQNQIKKNKVKIENNFPSLFPDFYFTLSMERKLNNSISTLLTRNKTLEVLVTDIKSNPRYLEILSSTLTPKQKSLLFLDFLKSLISPELTKVDYRLSQLTKDLKRQGANITFDPSYEESLINLNIKLKNDIEKENLITSLKRFSFDELTSILEGKNLD